MLVLSRRAGEVIRIGDDITVSKYRSACGQDGILISHGRKASLGQ